MEPETTGFKPATPPIEVVSVLRCDKCQKETGSTSNFCAEHSELRSE